MVNQLNFNHHNSMKLLLQQTNESKYLWLALQKVENQGIAEVFLGGQLNHLEDHNEERNEEIWEKIREKYLKTWGNSLILPTQG